MGNLPVPKSIEEAKRKLDNGSNGFIDGTSLGVKPLEFTTVELGPYRAEYAIKPEIHDVVVHFYRNDNGPYPMSFRQRIASAFHAWPGPNSGVDIDWVEEMWSFCVIVRSAMPMPGRDELEQVIKNVVA